VLTTEPGDQLVFVAVLAVAKSLATLDLIQDLDKSVPFLQWLGPPWSGGREHQMDLMSGRSLNPGES
jgi:hypothetical protein